MAKVSGYDKKESVIYWEMYSSFEKTNQMDWRDYEVNISGLK